MLTRLSAEMGPRLFKTWPETRRSLNEARLRRHRVVYINGRDETFVLLPQAFHGTMRDACVAMPNNTPSSHVIPYAMPM